METKTITNVNGVAYYTNAKGHLIPVASARSGIADTADALASGKTETAGTYYPVMMFAVAVAAKSKDGSAKRKALLDYAKAGKDDGAAMVATCDRIAAAYAKAVKAGGATAAAFGAEVAAGLYYGGNGTGACIRFIMSGGTAAAYGKRRAGERDATVKRETARKAAAVKAAKAKAKAAVK